MVTICPVRVSLSKTVNPLQPEECCSSAETDLWPLCGGGHVEGISLQGAVMCLISMLHGLWVWGGGGLLRDTSGFLWKSQTFRHYRLNLFFKVASSKRYRNSVVFICAVFMYYLSLFIYRHYIERCFTLAPPLKVNSPYWILPDRVNKAEGFLWHQPGA